MKAGWGSSLSAGRQGDRLQTKTQQGPLLPSTSMDSTEGSWRQLQQAQTVEIPLASGMQMTMGTGPHAADTGSQNPSHAVLQQHEAGETWLLLAARQSMMQYLTCVMKC